MHILKLTLQIFLAIYLVFSPIANIYSQTSGTLDGTVVDENNMPVDAALVTVTNQDDGSPYTARSNTQGKYVIAFLEPGRYTISIEKMGYQKTEKLNFVIPLNKTTVTLPPIVIRSISATPSIDPNQNNPANPTPTSSQPVASASGNDVLVELTDATNRSNYDSNLLTALPLGGVRTFDFFALLSPGVLPSPATTGAAGPGLGPGVGTSGQFSVNGRRARANNFTIDGSDNNDQDIGVRRQGFVSLVPQSIESVNEFQISTQVWDAEFGRNIGSQANAVSRSGGNEVHGTFYGFANFDELNARNFFDLTGGASGGKDQSSRFQGGFVLGGPVKKNKAHYFVSFERQDINGTQENHFAVPGPDELGFNRNPDFNLTKAGRAIKAILPLPNNIAGPYGVNNFTQTLSNDASGTVFSVKINQNFGKSTFTARYNFTDDESIIPSVGNAINASLGTETRTQNLSLFFNTQVSPSLYNQARVSYGRTTLDFPVQPSSPLLFGETASTLNIPELLRDFQRLGGNLNLRPETYTQGITSSFGTFNAFGRTGALGQLVVTPFSPVGVDPFTFPQGRSNNTYQIADTIVKSIGSHTIKLGADFRRTQLNSFLDRNFRPQAVFGSGFLAIPGIGSNLILGSDIASAAVPSQVFQAIATTPDSNIGLRFNEYNFFAQDSWRVNRKLSINYGLRYEFTSVPVEVNNKIEQTFNLQLPASNPNIANSQFGQMFQSIFEKVLSNSISSLNRFLDGRDKIFRSDKNNFSPRIGLAFDPFGKSTTSIRIGYGIYYDQIIGSVTSQSRNVFPNFIPVVFDPTFSFDIFGNVVKVAGSFGEPGLLDVGLSLDFIQPGSLNTLGFRGDLLRFGLGELLTATGSTNPFQRQGGGLAFVLPDANLRSPYSQHWNVSVEHQLGKDYVLNAAYVGSTGTKLIRFRTPNGGPNSFVILTSDSTLPNGFQPNPLAPPRKDPNLGPFTVIEASASSIYHSLQLSLSKRFNNGLQFGSSYTYGHSIDEVSDVFDTAGSFTLPQDENNLRAERGSASFDIRHRSVTYFNYDLPSFTRSSLLNGFQVNGVLTLQTGQPFTVNQAFDINRDGNLNDRLDSDALFQQVDKGIVRITSPSKSLRDALQLIGSGVRTGGVGRNTFRAPGVATLDLAVVKKFKLTDKQFLSVRTEFFNLFNRTHFGIPVRTFGAPAFGRSVNTSVPSRVIQFAVKYQF
ncbi:MAG: carboxypeptidase regulatory-like domain-containing protein [Acidobacteria bacterium]|nr:carboxypeptidase regulatory-like domain-containing protein [Acidobacteriota bacterium]